MTAETAPRPKVAMFVLNPCHNDARVRKEAASLGRHGFDVRIFALASTTHPEAILDEGDFVIHRLHVQSLYQRLVTRLGPGRRGVPLRGPRRWARDGGWALTAVVIWIVLRLRRGQPVRAPAATTVSRRARLRQVVMRVATGLGRVLPAGLRHRLRVTLRRADRAARRGARRILGTTRSAVRSAGRSGRRSAARLRRRTRRVVHAIRRVPRNFVRRRLIILHRPTIFRAYHRRAAQEAIAWRAEVAHGHDLNALPAAVAVADALHVPVVYDSHELWRHRNRVGNWQPLGRVADAFVERRLVRRTAHIITVGDAIAAWLVDRYGLPEGHVTVLRNVPPRRAAGLPLVSLRDRAGVGAAPLLLYTGRITTGRGLEDAIAVLGDVDVHLVMLGYGDPGYVEGLFGLAGRIGVGDRLHLVGPVAPDEVSATAAQADAVLVAIEPLCLSYRLALPNKLFEAIQAEVPVVASDLPEIAAIVRSHGVGELFASGDADGLRAALRRVLEAGRDAYAEPLAAAASVLCWEVEEAVLLDVYDGLGLDRAASVASSS